MADLETLLADTRYWAEVAAPGTPAAGSAVSYVTTDGKLHFKNDAGTDHDLTLMTFSGVRAVANAVTAIATATWTALAFAGADRFDTDAYHNPASNNTRLVVPAGKAGKYLIGGNAEIESNATGQRACRIFLNATTRIGGEQMQDTAAGSQPTRLIPHTLYDLAVADFVELQVWQNSGISLNSAQAANSTGEFWMYRVG